MSGSVQPIVQIRIEQGLHTPTRNATAAAGARRNRNFKTFSYTSNRKGGTAGRFTELSGPDQTDPAGGTVTVFGFTKTNELGRARNLVRNYSLRRQPMIAVASPSVFNQPAFRAVLTGDYVEVLVEDVEKFRINQLVPWIAKLMEPPAKRETANGKTPSPDSLDISMRLRCPASGRLDAGKFVNLFGISSTDLARVCGVSKQALSQSPTSAGIQDRLQPLEEIAQLLHWCGGVEAKLRAWLKRPNRDFPTVDGKVPSPMDLILRGHADVVANKVHNLRLGHPA